MPDADNALDRNFFASLNVTFSRGYDIITCYREFTTGDVVGGVKVGYVPIVIQSLFVTPEWTPIRHTLDLSARQIRRELREDAG